ncbi:MAG: UDP-N-acetylmuramoyl-L-alanyl-D-glutamate--2,6-diaminopimelate ligase [Acidimicrobiia bacterium]
MRLHDLLVGLDVIDVSDPEVEITSITNDSRRVAPGACYACIPGAHVDGHDFAADAVRAGASALLVERALDASVVGDVAQVRVARVRGVLGAAAANLYDHPSRAMRTLGVTGTNGKTTTTFLLEAIARAAGDVPGVIGTTGARVDGTSFASDQVTSTTPEACDLQRLLADMRAVGVGTVAMEVSSHGLDRREVDGTEFAAVCFTNLSHEHLDYHGSLDAYFDAKARLFDGSFALAAAINVDDVAGRSLLGRVARTDARVWTFGFAGGTDDAIITARDVAIDAQGTSFTLVDASQRSRAAIRLALVGPFNVANALAAAATARAAGIGFDSVVAGLTAAHGVPGRVEPVDRGQGFAVLVDYAHTPDALDGVLAAARALANGQRVLAVFGAGGDRDRAKRPLMGRAVAQGADVAILTSDNPRTEPPETIADEVLAGLRDGNAEVLVELDRRVAIHTAIARATDGDVVVIAGKGHETGQTIGARTQPFDDRVVAAEALEALGWS